jgi:L-asparagine transporter-like permease
MHYLPAIFSLLVAAAGWFYILHASRALTLKGFETDRDNRLRIRLRRIGGGLMIVLAVAFYVGYVFAGHVDRRWVALVCIMLVMLLLPVILFLAYVDLRLTRKMRESFKHRKP